MTKPKADEPRLFSPSTELPFVDVDGKIHADLPDHQPNDGQRWEHLLELALKNNLDKNGVLLNDLLAAFHRGFPLEKLRTLLDSSDPNVVASGAWILEELGDKGKPFTPYLPLLLQSNKWTVRGSAITHATNCLSPKDGNLVAILMQHIDDVDDAVRWKVVEFMMYTSHLILANAEPALRRASASSLLRALTILLYGDDEEARLLLDDAEARVRRFGIAAAFRRREVMVLKAAESSIDADVAMLAKRALRHIQREDEQKEKKMRPYRRL